MRRKVYNILLNFLTASHHLKVGAIVMLLRNLNLKSGLCNGTRLVVKQLHNNIIDAEVLTGVAAVDRVLIPRLELASSDTGLPFILRHRHHYDWLIL